MSPQFVEFLRNTPEALAALVDVVRSYNAKFGDVPKTGGGGPGPKQWKEGEAIKLHTQWLDPVELDLILAKKAEAVVIDKAVEFLKGFVTGVMVAA